MQTLTDQQAHDAVASAFTPQPKPVKRANAARRVQAKPAAKLTPKAKPGKQAPNKPTTEARERARADAADSRSLARQAARQAVAEFYSGASKPFKAASDRFSDLNPANAKAPSTRQAGLMLALITYGAGNFKPNGSFVRGGFIVPAKLVNANAKPGETIRAQPESGCLGNMLGRTISHVSGPITGKAQAEAVFKLDAKRALAEIQSAFGDKAANGARAMLQAHGVKLAA